MQSELFVGERLQLAREFRGLTQRALGDKVAASHALISLCETGKKKQPAVDLVEAISSVLGFEPEFFYRPLSDVFHEDECSFRHRRTTPERQKAQIRAHATLIGIVLERLGHLVKFPSFNLPTIPAKTYEEIEAAAEQCRRFWGLGLESPILQPGRVLERAGVIIVSHVAASKKVDAFSRCGRTAVIFLNQATLSSSRWVFDIAHECAHLVMHRGMQTGTLETEQAADRFASAFLMPRTAFSREFRASPFGWKHIFNLKRRWMTSAAAIVRRAYDLGLVGAVVYRQAFKYMSSRGWRSKGEPAEPHFQEPELLQMALKALGTKVGLSLDTLCEELGFTHETFFDVTGVPVPPERVKERSVIPLRGAR